MSNSRLFSAEGYARAVVSYPVLVCIISVLLVGLSVAGIRYLSFSTDYRVFFSKENPQLIAFETLQDIFSKNDNIFIVIHNNDGTIFDRKTLSVVENLTDAAWKTPFSRRVDSLTNFQHTKSKNDDLVVDNLVSDAVTLDEEALAYIRSAALGDERLVHRLVSPDSRTTSINVTLQLPGESRKEIPEAVAYIRSLIADLKADHSNLEFRLTGNVMMSNALSEASIADIKSLVPAMYGVIVICVLLLFRSFWAMILVSMMVVFSMISAVGLASWAGIVLTPPSASAPTIIMTLGVAGSIHVLTSFFMSLSDGLPRREAMIESVKVNLEPVSLTVLTTVIGFLSMNFSDTPPLRDLGNISAIGIVGTLLFTLFTLPAAAVLLPFKARKSDMGFSRLLSATAEVVIRRQRVLLWVLVAFSITMASFVPQLELNDQYVEYFDETIEFRRDTDFAMEHLTGIYKIEYLLQAEDSGGISRPEYLVEVRAFAEWFRVQPEVVHVQSIVETIETLNRSLHGDKASYERLPETRELTAQYLLLYEMSLPYGLDLTSQISIGKDATRLTVMLENLSTSELLDIEKRAQTWLESNTSSMVAGEGTGSSVIFAHMSKRSIDSMISGTLIAILLIGLVLVVALKSVKYGLLSLIPNLLPAVIAMGIWTIFVGELGFALSVMIAMTLGIVVDDTIHFLSKYIRGRRVQKLDPENAIRFAFSTVGVALVITSIVLVLGFIVLSQSSFLPNSGMSMLTGITITVALVLDLFMLPPLLLALDKPSTIAMLPENVD